MKLKICFIIILALASSQLYAQKEANNWFFGNNCGITWNTTQDLIATGMFGTLDKELKGLPTNISGTIPIVTYEGCFSLSDNKGNLLFFSDGTTIWDKNMNPMVNGTGLFGDFSATQSGIIIPYPEQANKYIAFSTKAGESKFAGDNLFYSVIDMNLNGGLGEVVSGQVNVPLVGYVGTVCETVASVKHSNGKDFWIIAPGRDSNPTFMNAWLVTKDGVSTTPVTTALAGVPLASSDVGGYLKISPDGRYFGWASYVHQRVIFGQFDNTTGACSNITMTSENGDFYGAEFSASGEYLYVVYFMGNMLYVYKTADLKAGIPSTPLQYSLPSLLPNNYPGALQLGPDGRMYMALNELDYLYVIDNPEEYDDLKIYKLPTGFLGSGRSSRIGLPSFAASWFYIEGETGFCVNTSQPFTVSLSGTSIAYTVWNFGDGTAETTDTDVSTMTQTHNHTYLKPGIYTITVRSYSNSDNLLKEETFDVEVYPCVMPVNPNVHM